MAGYLRGTENRANESTYAFNNLTFELIKSDSRRVAGSTDIFQNIAASSVYGLFSADHLFDLLATGDTWVKSQELPFYVRVLRPYYFKEYIVEAWWKGRLYKIVKTYKDDKIYINDKYFRWEKGEGEILCVGVYDGELYFWLKGRVEPQKVAERFGVPYEEPNNYKEVSFYESNKDGQFINLDYKYPIIVTDDSILCGDINMSFFAFSMKEVVLSSNYKTGDEYLTHEIVSVLRSLLNDSFEILMLDSYSSFKNEGGFSKTYVLTKLMGDNGYYLNNSVEGTILFAIGGTVYKIPIKGIVENADDVMISKNCTSGSVMVIRSSNELYLLYGTYLFKINGNTLYNMVDGTQCYEGCISDLSIEAVKRQYIIGNA